MENMSYNDYNIANLATDDIKYITDLENSINSKFSDEVVLIAYQHKKNQES